MLPFFQKPLNYKKSLGIASLLWIFGIVLEAIFQGKGVTMLPFPGNLIILASLMLFWGLIYFLRPKSYIVYLYTNIPFVITLLLVFAAMLTIAGTFPQYENNASITWRYLGWDHVTQSWPYAILVTSLLTSLSFVILKRIQRPLSLDNIGFVLSHLGFWLLLAVTHVGAGDLKVFKMHLEQGKTTSIGTDASGKTYELPFAIKLLQFEVEKYRPYIFVVEGSSDKVIDKQVTEGQLKIDTAYPFQDWQITVKKYYRSAYFVNGSFVPLEHPGSSPAIFAEARKNDIVHSGWMSCGSILQKPHFLAIGDYRLALAIPKPKKYKSMIQVWYPEFYLDHFELEVNKVLKHKNWWIYQYGYENQLKSPYPISILEVRYDPWLPFVYLAIVMFVLGTCIMIRK